MSEDFSPEQRKQMLNALLKGRKIEAIKLYREVTGGSLKDSKEYIEKITADLKAKHPEQFKNAQVGCGTAAALVVIGAPLFIYLGQRCL